MDNPNKWNHRVISWSWCSVLYRKCFSIQRMWRVMINVSFWFVWNNLSCHPALLSTRLTAHLWATSVARVTTFWCDSPRLYREQAHAVQVSKPDRFYSWWIILYPIMVISPPMYMRKQIFMVHQRDKIQNLWLVFSFNSESRAYPSKH